MLRYVAVVACVCSLTSLGGAAVSVLDDVPSYIWYHGCGPTAAGMIIGYWDGRGFDELIPGSNDWSANQQAVKDMIASPGHIRDYVPWPDRIATPEDPYHADDCVADFMECSRDPYDYGYSRESLQDDGMTGYARYRGYPNSVGHHMIYGICWAMLISEVDAGRPIELFVDSDADGSGDHYVTAIGYDDAPGAEMYACYNTYDHSVHWHDFGVPQGGKPYGVTSGALFRLYPNGDANRDGIVDGADYTAWADNYGQPGGYTDGDFNEDGLVDGADYTVWADNYTGQGPTATAVPEPASGTVLLAGFALLVVRRRRAGAVARAA